MARLSRIPLAYQLGDAWLYNTCSDILGVLIARVSGRTLPEFLAERLCEPLGMVDTGFEVPAGKLDRFTSYYRIDPSGEVELVDARSGQWSGPPVFPSGTGGLVSTLVDWHAFALMLLAEGTVGRPPTVVAGVGAPDDDRPPDPAPAGGQPVVPGGPGLGLRRFGRRRGHRSPERARTLWLGRRHRNSSACHSVQRSSHHPAHSTGNDRTDPAHLDAGLLAICR
jgi:CubicO group peptidase (beta-lactamase class C family)